MQKTKNDVEKMIDLKEQYRYLSLMPKGAIFLQITNTLKIVFKNLLLLFLNVWIWLRIPNTAPDTEGHDGSGYETLRISVQMPVPQY